jgi:uncharacterized protein YndB with AHSA1/START domain
MISEAAEADREIVSTRAFPVPRAHLYEAFRDPDHLKHWWGPKGFTNSIEVFDLRPGGEWRLTMHGPNGADYPNAKTFTEVMPEERVVFQHHGPMHRFIMSLFFADDPAGSRLTWRMLFESAEHTAQIRGFVTAANEENFDRLTAYLQKMDVTPV